MKFISLEETNLSQEVGNGYVRLGRLPNGEICGVARLLFHYTLHVGIDEFGYRDRYCYQTLDLATNALKDWNGVGDPENWHRHPLTGRRRDLVTGKECIAF